MAWRRPGFPGQLTTVAGLLARCFLLFGMVRIALVDLGQSLALTGLLVGTTAPLLALPIIPLTGLAVARFGPEPGFRFLPAACSGDRAGLGACRNAGLALASGGGEPCQNGGVERDLCLHPLSAALVVRGRAPGQQLRHALWRRQSGRRYRLVGVLPADKWDVHRGEQRCAIKMPLLACEVSREACRLKAKRDGLYATEHGRAGRRHSPSQPGPAMRGQKRMVA